MQKQLHFRETKMHNECLYGCKINNKLGPSFSMDGGWICGSNGLEKAKRLIENGTIHSAIVGVTNLILTPQVQLQFQGINRLNQTINTKSFSFDGKFFFLLSN